MRGKPSIHDATARLQPDDQSVAALHRPQRAGTPTLDHGVHHRTARNPTITDGRFARRFVSIAPLIVPLIVSASAG
jgi:hypothetical protein